MIDWKAAFDDEPVALTDLPSSPTQEPAATSDADERGAIVVLEAKTEIVSRAWEWGDLVPVGWKPRAWAYRLTYLADQFRRYNPTGAVSMLDRVAEIHKRIERGGDGEHADLPPWAAAMIPE